MYQYIRIHEAHACVSPLTDTTKYVILYAGFHEINNQSTFLGNKTKPKEVGQISIQVPKAFTAPIFTKLNNVYLNFINTSHTDFYPDRSRNIDSNSQHLFRRLSKLLLFPSRVLQNSHFLDKFPDRTSVGKVTTNLMAGSVVEFRSHTHGHKDKRRVGVVST
jgi:hypothetical protein